ncbi:MAG: hypothetical protein HZC15_02300 [Candidatus Omnitrophica bacterium]|nr:hypothetical protein [Candidatus Omnitrophota bacterium]
MEQFYLLTKDNLKKLVGCNDASLWKDFINELFQGIASFFNEERYFLFTYKLQDYEADYPFYHLINISFLGSRIAKEMNFSETRLRNLVVMSLFHDKKIFDVPAELSATLFEFDKEADDVIKVVDVFDSIINPPPYRKFAVPWMASEALKDIVEARGDILSPRVVETFFRVVTVYPVGTWVLLTNNLIGQVKRVNRSFILRPQIEIIGHMEGYRVQPYIVDLSKEQLLNIKEILSDKEVEEKLRSR